METINSHVRMHGSQTQSAAPRPSSWKEFVGQKHLRSIIQTSAKAAIQRNAAFPHTLITGPAGMGKTSLAAVIAAEMGYVDLIATTAEALEDSNAVKGLLSRLDDKGYDRNGQPIGPIRPSVLFLDEVHRLPRQSQELLYGCIEDRILDVKVKDPISGLVKGVREWVPCFGLIVSTTHPGFLTSSFRDRLRLHLQMEMYSESESAQIARQALKSMGIACSPKLAGLIATRGRGIPRRILGLCEQVRDQALVARKRTIDSKICTKAFEALGLDPIGLGRNDIGILKLLASQIGNPVGIKTLAATTGEDERTIEETTEPFLLGKGLIAKTPRGRAITPVGLEHLREHHGYESSRRTLA